MDSDIHGSSIPSSALAVSREYYASLMEGQRRGASIEVSSKGLPVLQEASLLSKTALRAAIASRRRSVAARGTMNGGMSIDTSPAGQAALMGAVMAAQLDVGYRCSWKTANGFIEIGAEKIVDMALAVRAHVQSSFNREAELLAHLEGGTFVESMLDEGWPS